MDVSRRTRFFSKRPAISQAVSQRRVLAVLRNALPSYQRRCLPHEQFCHFSPSDAYQGGCVNRNRMYFWVIDKMNSERLTCEESHFYEQVETYLRTRLPTPCVSQYSFRQSGRAKPKMAGSCFWQLDSAPPWPSPKEHFCLGLIGNRIWRLAGSGAGAVVVAHV